MESGYYRVQHVVDVETVGQFRADLLRMAQAKCGDVVVDCVNLEFIDSIGVAVISQVRRVLAVHGRRLRLINVSPTVRRPFEVLGHSDYLELEEV